MEPRLYKLILSIKTKCLANEARIRSELDLSQAEFNTLISLHGDDVLSGQDLARQMGLSPSRTSRVVFKMQKRGWLNVTQMKRDRRGITIRLSAKGRTMQKKLEGKMVDCEKQITNGLPARSVPGIARSLETLVAVL